MPGLHSSLGASRAHCYRRCPGSVKAQEGLPDTAGIDAAHGTVFHEVAADVLELGLDPHKLVGLHVEVEGFGKLPFTQEMAVKMQPGLEMLWALSDEPSAVMLVEQRLDLERWLGPDQFGTSDACVIDVRNKMIVVFDWKWGAGVPVSPVGNDQAIVYALGVWNKFEDRFDGIDPEEILVKVIIEQPRAAGGGGVWDTTVADLLAEGKKLKRDAARTRDPNAPRIPGLVQCKFCSAARFKTCPEYVEFNLNLVRQKFDDLDETFEIGASPPDPSRLAITPEQRSQILLHESMWKAFFAELHEAAFADARAGRPTPGMKLVDGRAPARAWADEKKAEIVVKKKLGKDAMNVTLKSPTQVEEVLGKTAFQKTFGSFVHIGEPKPVLVPEHDKRKARLNVHEKFDNLDDI